ncbi:hypothetical protein [Streptomyces sp. NPDC006477]|uniref:hypothetical protein n=1 Tax=Streptomyces sp. NPDC006477 TaxID=3364747 RepID=UPI003698C67D
MTQPAPDSRHSVDSITSDALDALYERAKQAEAEVARYKAAVAEIRAELIHWDGVVIHRIRAALDAHTNPKDQTPTATKEN